MQPDAHLLSLDEARQLLDLDEVRSYELAQAGRFPGAFRHGRVWKVSRPAIDKFLANPHDLTLDTVEV